MSEIQALSCSPTYKLRFAKSIFCVDVYEWRSYLQLQQIKVR